MTPELEIFDGGIISFGEDFLLHNLCAKIRELFSFNV